MQRAVYEERRAAEVKAYKDAAAALLPLIEASVSQSAERMAVVEAESMLREAATMIAHLGDRLFPYSQPEFYADIQPSRAKEDGGKFAADGLEYVFSE